jgi:ubiquinol-cytochrome c reductase cytochrome c1 subunit
MKTRAFALFMTLLAPGLVLAAGGPAIELDKADIDLGNKASLQRGAKYFVNYCMGCHSLEYSRYNRVAADLEIPEDLVQENLIFTRDRKGELHKVGEKMEIAMDPVDAAEWFGAAPPDLTLNARVNGPDYLYTYLRTFYVDPSRPLGVNNLAYPNVGMPHALWPLQGWQEKVVEVDEDGHEQTRLELVQAGTLTPAEYDKVVRDIVAFLTYVAEPAKLERYRLGVWVLLFLGFFFVFAYYLKKEYWKDVH